jgi:hypothetical protein
MGLPVVPSLGRTKVSPGTQVVPAKHDTVSPGFKDNPLTWSRVLNGVPVVIPSFASDPPTGST